MKFKSSILKLALFATGLSGIVAEYILSTLATYFLGDSAVQWALIVSVMLFSMGVGSRLSQYIHSHLLLRFVYIEFTLSILVAFSSTITYFLAGYIGYIGWIIYSLSILIGILIGMEIPLVIRLNKEFQELRINVASVMEKDYLGSLAGGLFFAFVGLPYLGLTYTPFLLGLVNFGVAILLLYYVKRSLALRQMRQASLSGTVVFALVLSGVFWAQPVILHGEQARYQDKVILTEQSRYQRVVLTQWKDHYWLYLNGNQQLSTLDEAMYHEPLVHPAMQLGAPKRDVLILGGGDGCAAREVLKYPLVKRIDLVDLDSLVTHLAKSHPVLTEANDSALHHDKVHITHADGFHYLEHTRAMYDLIILDLPDPRTIEINRLYTLELYSLARQALRPGGVVITQAGSPYLATRAFRCIEKTMAAAGLGTAGLHHHVVTLGEWGWVLGQKAPLDTLVKERLQKLTFENVETRWLNQEATQMMTRFGKAIYGQDTGNIKVNRVQEPVLYRYYLKGNWDLY